MSRTSAAVRLAGTTATPPLLRTRGLSLAALTLLLFGCAAPGAASPENDLAAPDFGAGTGPAADRSDQQILQDATAIAIKDFAATAARDPADINLTSARRVTWRDGSLGCPREGYMYAQVLTAGILIELELDGDAASYHAGGDGKPFRCEDPQPPLPPSDAGGQA